MNLFEPRTFSTDWEVMVVDGLERLVPDSTLNGFAGQLRTELGLPVTTDWHTIEFCLGVNRSLDQFWDAIVRTTDRARQIVREYDLDLFPCGAHPVEQPFNADHIHVGTIRDEPGGFRLEALMAPYAPAFGALAANSAASHRRRGEFKSYRIRYRAHGALAPVSARDPHVSQAGGWGSDAAPKVYGAPTVEVRITDAASSRRFLAELATFVGAFVHHLGTRAEREPLRSDEYLDYLTNRWAAARDGMQATFCHIGRPRPVADLLDEMLDMCAPELAQLGASRADLGVVNRMIERRVCQADLTRSLAERYPDDYMLASALRKLLRDWTVFEEFLDGSPALDPLPHPDEGAIDAAHLKLIGEGTHFFRTRDAMNYPPPVVDGIVDRLVDRGLVERETAGVGGTLLRRTAQER